MGVVDELVRARETYERGDWVAAFEAWSDVTPDALPAADLENLATAAELLGRHEVCVDALQRAFQVNLDAGAVAPAVRCAARLAMVFSTAGEPMVGGGWAARAQRLLEDLDEDVVERGYVELLQMYRHIGSEEWTDAAACAARLTAYGRRFADPDLTAMGLAAQGRLSLYLDQVPEGLALFDEAMVAVSTGEVSPVFAGHVYCVMIEGCQEVSDLGRAAAWTSVLTRWCSSQPGLVTFTGQCAVHRGQIMRLHGAYPRAVEELDGALQRYLASPTPEAAGLALAERGDVFRLMGDLDAAEASYDRAADHGYEAQPGLALLWLARGRTQAAVAAIRRVLVENPNRVHRSRMLPAAVEILLAGDDLAGARALATELEAIAHDFRCDALQAMAAQAAGRVELESGDAPGALPYLRKASGLWSAMDCPYEVARVHVLVARALRALGDEESAGNELAAAHRTFLRLGATPAADEAAEPPDAGGSPPGPDRTGGAGAAAGGVREEQHPDRGRAGAQRQDRGTAPEQHLHEAGRRLAHRRRGVRLRARPRLSRLARGRVEDCG